MAAILLGAPGGATAHPEGASLLANVNPTFNWVRLAQRVPVRIALDQIPDSVALVAGRSATVEVLK